jgi:hypothetical protein
MTEHSTSQPPRLLPDQPFPPYAYVPGHTPHPTRDPDGRVACGRRGPTATYLQALINLAAAGLKARSGNARGMRANADKAVCLFKSVAVHVGSHGTRYMGLDFRALADYANTIAKSPQTTETAAGDENLPAFDLLLWPD